MEKAASLSLLAEVHRPNTILLQEPIPEGGHQLLPRQPKFFAAARHLTKARALQAFVTSWDMMQTFFL